MKSKKGIVVLLTTFVIVILAAVPALAASPHFVSASGSINSAGQLVVSWKEAGLGDDVAVDYTLTAFATADYGCINGGGKHPDAANKFTVSGPVSASDTFFSGKNGEISASLTVDPPSAGSFTCPSGQRLVLADVSYTGVVLTDTSNGVTADIPGTFSETFFTFK